MHLTVSKSRALTYNCVTWLLEDLFNTNGNSHVKPLSIISHRCHLGRWDKCRIPAPPGSGTSHSWAQYLDRQKGQGVKGDTFNHSNGIKQKQFSPQKQIGILAKEVLRRISLIFFVVLRLSAFSRDDQNQGVRWWIFYHYFPGLRISVLYPV